MDSLGQNWFQMASQRMEWLSRRQTIIAENIANADTPGFVGRDVNTFEDFLNSDTASGTGVVVEDATGTWAGSKDGNTVVLEEQAVLSAQTAGEFRLASRLYAKGHQLIAMATGRK